MDKQKNMAARICPLCEGHHHRFFEHVVQAQVTVPYLICDRCGFVFQERAWTQTELDEFYAHQYRTLMQGNEKPQDRNRAIENARAELNLNRLKKLGVNIHRHLDIGASTGAFLCCTQRGLGCEGVGIEPGEGHREFATQRGLRVLPSLDELASNETERFELISLIHVLEHLPEPVNTLKMLREKWLAPDGWLLVEVPNLYAHQCLEIAHLTAFSAHTLTEMVRIAGYDVISIASHGLPRSKILALNLTLIAKPQQSPHHASQIRPERMVRLKRRIGMTYRALVNRWAWLPYPELKEISS